MVLWRAKEPKSFFLDSSGSGYTITDGEDVDAAAILNRGHIGSDRSVIVLTEGASSSMFWCHVSSRWL